MSMREVLIDKIIRNAIEDGAFDDLPGRGKPLNLAEDPFVKPEWRLAYHGERSSPGVCFANSSESFAFALLKQHGFAPDWIERRRAIEVELAAARTRLARAWAWRARSLEAGEPGAFVEGEWRRARGEFAARIEKLNCKIRDYNLLIPSPAFERRRVNAEREVERATVEGRAEG